MEDATDAQQAAHPGGRGLPPDAAWLLERTPHELDTLLREVLSLGVEVRHAFARRLGLGENELAAMEHLMAEPVGPVELSRRLGVTSAAATLLLHRLSEAGHVERRPHPGDRRRQVVVPTPQGMSGVFRELRPMVTALDELALGLDDDERAVVARYLRDVAAVLRRTADTGPPPPHRADRGEPAGER
jgi:DNA-binding MarR family transcriptional regulator